MEQAKMTVLVCDDEGLARQRLRRLLERAAVEVAAEAATGREAVELAVRLRPDVVLMDVRMPDMDGMEAAARLQRMASPPALIFCTAYEEHALPAFRVQAVDYLLKPVNADDLERALERARSRNRVQAIEAGQRIALARAGRRFFNARSFRGLQRVALEEVRYFQADNKYVTVHYQGGRIVIDEPLKSLEREFHDLFVRIHRSTLVSLHFIDSVVGSPEGRFEVRLRGVRETLPVSRRHVAGLRRALAGKQP